MAAKITCAAKTNKTNEAVTKMKATLIDRGEHPTQVKVAEELGMSLSTVKRNWYQKEIDLFKIPLQAIVEGFFILIRCSSNRYRFTD